MNKGFVAAVLFGVLISGSAFAESRMAGSQVLSAGTRERMAQETAEAAKNTDAQTKETAKQQAIASNKQAVSVAAQAPVKMSVPVAQQPIQQTAMTPRPAGPKNYVGEIEVYRAKGDDTLQSIGEANDLGYVEIRSANPAGDPWKPGAGTYMILPKMHLLPDGPRKGIVINLSEMRLYYYAPNGEVHAYPIGVGREGFTTPMGSTSVVSKTRGPTWTPTDRMRREDPTLKAFYGPGPDNPLGTVAMYLGWPQYRIHGTNKPWGIGRRVSSGCIRMYNPNAEALFSMVTPGTPVTTVRQAIKFAWIGNMLYIEAHPDESLADQAERTGGEVDYKVPADIFANLSRAAGREARDKVDWRAVREALRLRQGYPVPILIGATDKDRFVTKAMEARADTSRFTPSESEPALAQEQAPQPVPQAQAQATEVQTDSASVTSRRQRMSRFN